MRPRRNFFRMLPRGGLTLLELLIAVSIMVLIAGSLGFLCQAVRTGSEYEDGQSLLVQHARVTLEEMTRTVQNAMANEKFPGFLVIREEYPGGWTFPVILVVWSATEAPYEDSGGTSVPRMPRLKDLVIYAPDRTWPNHLLRIRVVDESFGQERLSEDPAIRWNQIMAIRQSPTAQRVVLTNLVRTVGVPGSPSVRQAMVWFVPYYRPSEEQWKDSSTAWEQLPWVQGIRGSDWGLRQAWLRIELQLVPGADAGADDSEGYHTVPFFGSAALYFPMHQRFRP